MKKKVAVFGLDCASPDLIFNKYQKNLPNISRLMQNGCFGKLRSCHPPITIPAWMSMLTGQDPGRLGLYGFRNRRDYSYENLYFANGNAIKIPTIWDILGSHGKKVILIGIPETYPPKPVNGWLVTSFMTPGLESQYTYPSDLRYEINEVVGDYMFDVPQFRSPNKQSILNSIYQMTEKRFNLARHLLQSKPWDFFMMVEMGPDRIHHGFWKYMDPSHPKYEADSPFHEAIRQYYEYLDGEIGKTMELFDDNTSVFVVSDHGAKAMQGGICINEYLVREKYLALKNYPHKVTPFKDCQVDWPNTKAWGEGGYYSRIFLNVKGREPQGVIPPEEYEKVRNELIKKIEVIGNEKGQSIGTRVYRPQDLYKVCNGVPPDLIAYLGDLSWRSVGSLGFNAIHTFENDSGPDDANHDWDGVFIWHDQKINLKGKELSNLRLVDIGPTLLNEYGLSFQTEIDGSPIFR